MGDSQSKQFGDQYLGKLSDQLDKTAPVFTQSLFAGAGDVTKDAWRQGAQFGNDLIAQGGLTDPMRSAMDTFGSVGTGFGAAGDASTNRLNPLYRGYANAGGQSRADLGSIFNGYGVIGSKGGLSGAQRGAMSDYGSLGSEYKALSGAYDQNAPGYARMRQGLLDDAVKNVGAGFTASGRFGGGSYIGDATEASLDAIAPLDYQNFQNSVNNKYRSLDSQAGIFSGLFGMGQQGMNNRLAALGGQAGAANSMFGNTASALAGQAGITNSMFDNRMAALNGEQGAAGSLFNAGQQGVTNQQGAIDALSQIGAARDANAQGKLLGEADLLDRTKNAELDRLLKLGAAFGDPVAAANQPNWLQQGLGALLGFGGSALSGGAFGG